MKRRLVYFLLSIVCFVVCVLIVLLFSENQFIRGFIGDIIVMFLIYFFVKTFYDFQAMRLAVFILIVAFVIEFLQYLRIITFLGLQYNTAAKIILGSVFDPFDLIAYTIGAVSVYVIDTKLVRRAV